MDRRLIQIMATHAEFAHRDQAHERTRATPADTA
jgi:hypothetical protein